MGTTASSEAGRRGAATAAPTTSSPPPSSVTAPTRTYTGYPVRGLIDAPARVLVKLDKEALLILDGETQEVFRTFSYYRILCWGSTPQTFMWKAYTDDSETDLEAHAVSCEDGSEMEDALMFTIQTLMGDMASRGVPDEQFATLINTLSGLAEEGFGDHCLTVVRQMALGRAFDARQATLMIRTIGQVSPFEKLEAAVMLYPTLLSPESFLVVLDAFEDGGDRDNVLHRLGLKVRNGRFEETPPPGGRRKR